MIHASAYILIGGQNQRFGSQKWKVQIEGKPGLGTIHRTGYLEKDLVDYDTKNLKFNSAIHYKTKNNNELIYSSNLYCLIF